MIERYSNPHEAQSDVVDLTREGGDSGLEEPDYGKAEGPEFKITSLPFQHKMHCLLIDP